MLTLAALQREYAIVRGHAALAAAMPGGEQLRSGDAEEVFAQLITLCELPWLAGPGWLAGWPGWVAGWAGWLAGCAGFAKRTPHACTMCGLHPSAASPGSVFALGHPGRFRA